MDLLGFLQDRFSHETALMTIVFMGQVPMGLTFLSAPQTQDSSSPAVSQKFFIPF